MIVDLDANNALLSIEKDQSDKVYIRTLKQLHDEGKLTLRICGIGASEYSPNYSEKQIFQAFQERLNSAGLGSCEILKPILRLGMTYVGHCVLGGGGATDLDAAIHSILHPNIPFEYTDFCKQRGIEVADEVDRTWLNAICDTQSLWSHVYYRGDMFVSGDQNYKKETKLPKLMALGAKQILTPKEAATVLAVKEAITNPSIQVNWKAEEPNPVQDNLPLRDRVNDWIRQSKAKLSDEYGIRADKDGKLWVLKFFAPKYLDSFEAGGRHLTISCVPGFTWGDGIYVAPLEYPFSPMIFGRAGVMGFLEWKHSLRVYDAADIRGIELYQEWIQGKRQLYKMLTATIHADRANRYLRNMFRRNFKIDLVFFRPDQYHGSYVVPSRDLWFAVSDFDRIPPHAPALDLPLPSDKVLACRWVALVTEDLQPAKSKTHYDASIAPSLPRMIDARTRNTTGIISALQNCYRNNRKPSAAKPHDLFIEDI